MQERLTEVILRIALYHTFYKAYFISSPGEKFFLSHINPSVYRHLSRCHITYALLHG